MNSRIKKMMEYNKVFVDNELYQKYATTKFPDKKIAIFTCMDTRMTELLPAALGLKNGDVKLIKNAGTEIQSPYDSVVFSLLVAIYEMGVDTILVVSHDDCGGKALNGFNIVEKMREKGISQEELDHFSAEHKPVEEWLMGFGDVDKSVARTIEIIKSHPLIHAGVEVFGVIMDPATGLIREVAE